MFAIGRALILSARLAGKPKCGSVPVLSWRSAVESNACWRTAAPGQCGALCTEMSTGSYAQADLYVETNSLFVSNRSTANNVPVDFSLPRDALHRSIFRRAKAVTRHRLTPQSVNDSPNRSAFGGATLRLHPCSLTPACAPRLSRPSRPKSLNRGPAILARHIWSCTQAAHTTTLAPKSVKRSGRRVLSTGWLFKTLQVALSKRRAATAFDKSVGMEAASAQSTHPDEASASAER